MGYNYPVKKCFLWDNLTFFTCIPSGTMGFYFCRIPEQKPSSQLSLFFTHLRYLSHLDVFECYITSHLMSLSRVLFDYQAILFFNGQDCNSISVGDRSVITFRVLSFKEELKKFLINSLLAYESWL